jgi:hypothetical protein
MDPKEGDQQDQGDPSIQTEAERIAARLAKPLNQTPLPAPDSTLSESNTVLQILSGQSLRIDQMGKVLQLLADRMEATMTETAETMRLAQIVIAEQDRQLTALHELIDRQETTVQALVIVQGNLSELVSAILHDDSNQKA